MNSMSNYINNNYRFKLLLVSVGFILFFGLKSNAAVSILSHPESQQINIGDSITLSVEATGIGDISYQWYKDGLFIKEATDSSYFVPEVSKWDIGEYKVVITDESGSTYSNPAQIIVIGINNEIWKGLIHYFAFRGNTVDLGPSKNNFINTNAINTFDRFGNPDEAFAFDGLNSWMITEENLSISGSEPRTFSFWVYFEDRSNYGGEPNILSHGIKSGTGNLFSISLYDRSESRHIFMHGSWRDSGMIKPYFFPYEEWTHVVVSSNGTTSTTEIYLDGVKQQTQSGHSGGLNTIQTKLRISTSSDSGGISNDSYIWWNAGFKGLIDDLRVYNRVLESDDIMALYLSESSFGPPPDSVPVAAELNGLHEPVIGDTVTLDATATSGFPLPTYQWYYNGNPIPAAAGGTNPVLEFTATLFPIVDGVYRCVATNSEGSDEVETKVYVFQDADSDGLSNYREENINLTDISDPDSDGDGLLDGFEVFDSNTDPNVADTDGDLLSDGIEVLEANSDPNLVDTDEDLLSDYDEFMVHFSSPTSTDTDGDGIGDYDEVVTTLTNPALADTDADGLNDFDELNTHSTNPLVSDMDGDGLSDGEEILTHQTDPESIDSDGDNFADKFEIETGFDPNSASSLPDAQSEIIMAIEFSFLAELGTVYRIETSNDLETWTVVESDIQGTGGRIDRLYSKREEDRKFFRAMKVGVE